MSSNPWISGAVPFGKYLDDARAESRAYAEAEIDYLGPATPETRAEVKAARRAEQRKSMQQMAIAYGVFFLLAAFFALGTIVGNVNDADVRDIPWPTSVSSGERAEPEESAR